MEPYVRGMKWLWVWHWVHMYNWVYVACTAGHRIMTLHQKGVIWMTWMEVLKKRHVRIKKENKGERHKRCAGTAVGCERRGRLSYWDLQLIKNTSSVRNIKNQGRRPSPGTQLYCSSFKMGYLFSYLGIPVSYKLTDVPQCQAWLGETGYFFTKLLPSK